MSNSKQSSGDDPSKGPSLRRLVFETALFTIIIVGAVVLAGYLFRSPLEAMARWLIAAMGYAGLFVGVFAADAFTVPIPPDAYLFISVASGASVPLTLLSCSVASIVAGNLAYVIGPYIERIPLLRERLQEFRPRGEYLFDHWGGRAVAVAALTPVPFSIVSWLAGIYGMRYRAYFAASLFRVPRIVGYYALYAYGWAPATV